MVHHFTLTLAGHDLVDERIANGLYEAGCDDGSPHSTGGVLYVGFDREAPSYDEAVASAKAAVEGAGLGLTVVKVEPDDFGGGAEGESDDDPKAQPETIPAAGQ